MHTSAYILHFRVIRRTIWTFWRIVTILSILAIFISIKHNFNLNQYSHMIHHLKDLHVYFENILWKHLHTSTSNHLYRSYLSCFQEISQFVKISIFEAVIHSFIFSSQQSVICNLKVCDRFFNLYDYQSLKHFT